MIIFSPVWERIGIRFIKEYKYGLYEILTYIDFHCLFKLSQLLFCNLEIDIAPWYDHAYTCAIITGWFKKNIVTTYGL